MSYTKEQIIEYLKSQENIDSAIENIDYIDSGLRKAVRGDKVLFYIDKEIITKGQLKTRLIKYMHDNGWETRGYEDAMKLDDLLSLCEITIE
jgi:hypothetical protein